MNVYDHSLGTSTRVADTSSAHIDESKERLSQFGSPDSRLRLSISRQTPGLSEGLSDIDAMSAQMDIYDDVVEGIAFACIECCNNVELRCLSNSCGV